MIIAFGMTCPRLKGPFSSLDEAEEWLKKNGWKRKFPRLKDRTGWIHYWFKRQKRAYILSVSSQYAPFF